MITWKKPSEELPVPNSIVWCRRDKRFSQTIYLAVRKGKPLSTNPDPSRDCHWWGSAYKEGSQFPLDFHASSNFSDITVEAWAYVVRPD